MQDDTHIKHNRLIVAAIDFGTTYSGYAYCSRDAYMNNLDNPKIFCPQWNEGTFLSVKAPTCVLFDPDKKFHSFGYEARKHYRENPSKVDLTQWYYFEHFKMMLYKEKYLTTEIYLEESLNLEHKEKRKTMKAVDVFAAVIYFFKNHLLGDFTRKTKDFTENDVQWVITVPAIWDIKAKQFMRDSAKKAGISNDQLSLALEPEAASIHCRRVPVGVETEGDGRKIISTMNIGSKFIVLDQGGGTTDIAVHEVTGINTLREIHPACGGQWGGMTVNEEFFKFLVEIIGDDVINAIKESTPSAYFELLHGFEHTKTTFKIEDVNNPEGWKTFRIPAQWVEMFESLNGFSVTEHIKKSNFKGKVKVYADKMRLRNNVFRTFFDYSIKHITEELNTLLQKQTLSDVNTLLLVGGHSESTVLTEAIKDKFNTMGIVVPKEPSLAVLKGAVLFGFEPEMITSRVSRFTLGIQTRILFKEGVHSPSLKSKLVDGYIKDVFDKHVEIGQIPKVSEKEYLPERDYVPLYKDQKGVDFKFFETLNKHPEYTTDKGCQCIGTLYFKLTEGMSDKNVMALKINVGGTELVARVTEKSTGKTTKGYFRLPKE